MCHLPLTNFLSKIPKNFASSIIFVKILEVHLLVWILSTKDISCSTNQWKWWELKKMCFLRGVEIFYMCIKIQLSWSSKNLYFILGDRRLSSNTSENSCKRYKNGMTYWSAIETLIYLASGVVNPIHVCSLIANIMGKCA